jgi:hypothetical protein
MLVHRPAAINIQKPLFGEGDCRPCLILEIRRFSNLPSRQSKRARISSQWLPHGGEKSRLYRSGRHVIRSGERESSFNNLADQGRRMIRMGEI